MTPEDLSEQCWNDLFGKLPELGLTTKEVITARIATAIREACAEAVAEALREGLRDMPVTPAHLHAIRETAEYVKGRGDATGQTMDILDLCRVIDHQSARIAALANDSGQWQDGYRAGKADAEPEASCEVVQTDMPLFARFARGETAEAQPPP